MLLRFSVSRIILKEWPNVLFFIVLFDLSMHKVWNNAKCMSLKTPCWIRDSVGYDFFLLEPMLKHPKGGVKKNYIK